MVQRDADQTAKNHITGLTVSKSDGIPVLFCKKAKKNVNTCGLRKLVTVDCCSRLWSLIAMPSGTQHAPVMTKCRKGVTNCDGRKAVTLNSAVVPRARAL